MQDASGNLQFLARSLACPEKPGIGERNADLPGQGFKEALVGGRECAWPERLYRNGADQFIARTERHPEPRTGRGSYVYGRDR